MVFLQGQGKQTGGVFSFKPIPWMMDLSFVRCLVVFKSQHAQSSTVARAEYGVKLVMFTGNKKPH